MRKIIYFILCIASTAIIVYMGYQLWLKINETGITFKNAVWFFATIGWISITYNIATKSYKWTRKLCK